MYSLEEIQTAIDIVIGDDGFRGKEVAKVLKEIGNHDIYYTSDWCLDDVDFILGERDIAMLRTVEKANCLIELVDLLSGTIGMEYLAEIVQNKIDTKYQEQS
tara:strand:- start:249 stop:554 length:306 start_codon:yes stop_codon:yes gene_type:complete